MATQAGNGTPQANPGPTLNVLAQYIKDLSFENPHAPRGLNAANEAPSIELQVNVGGQPIQGDDYAVELKIEGRAVVKAGVMFSFDLLYGGAFRVSGFPEEQTHQVVMIECPRMLFPFAREIIATVVRNGGFPPLMIDPIDFASLYQQRMAEVAQQGNVKPA